MKQVIIKQFITMILAICLVSSCQKETPVSNDISGADKLTSTEKINEPAAIEARAGNTEASAAASKSVTANCSTCNAGNNSYDLLPLLKTMPLKEGNNVVSILDNGTKVVAQVKKGMITQWILQDKAGTQYLPVAAENLNQRIKRPGGIHNVYRICFYLDGLYNCWLVIRI